MKVNWKSSENESPILFSRRAAWTGFHIRHWRVLPGELVAETRVRHEINVALAGAVTTEKYTAGRQQKNRHETGSVCLIPAGGSAKAVWESEIECLSMTLDPTFFAQAAFEQNFSDNFELIETFERHDPLVQYIGLALLTEANAEESVGQMYAESLAQTLILHLLKNYSAAGVGCRQENTNGGLSGYKLRRAKEFIGEHLEEDLTLSQVAEAVGFSRFHFNRAFRKSTGLTPQQYLVARRISRAKELLTKGDLPLVEVGICAGFKNQSHFTTLFRKFTALTPKAFRAAKRR